MLSFSFPRKEREASKGSLVETLSIKIKEWKCSRWYCLEGGTTGLSSVGFEMGFAVGFGDLRWVLFCSIRWTPSCVGFFSFGDAGEEYLERRANGGEYPSKKTMVRERGMLE